MESVTRDSLQKVTHYLNTDKTRSFLHLLVVLNLNPEWKTEFAPLLLSLIDSISIKFITTRKVNEFFKCFEQALDLYPDNPEFKRCFSGHLQTLGYTFKAFLFMNSAVKLKPEEPLWTKELDSIKNSVLERWHFRMLNDPVRNESYRCAIAKCIGENNTVLDIGCGSGLLSLYIAENKPKRQIAVESNEALYNVSLSVFNDSKINNIVVKNALSTSLNSQDITGPVQIIVTEIFDGGLFGEGVLQTMIHARKYLMENSENVKVIPMSATLYICGMQSEVLDKKYRVIKSALTKELKLNSFNIHSNVDEPYDTEDLCLIRDIKYVTEPHQFLTLDLLDIEQMERLYNGEDMFNITLNVSRRSNVSAFAVWFDLHLCEGVKITTNPNVINRAKAWQQAVMYPSQLLTCEDNSTVNVSLSCQAGKLRMTNASHLNIEHFYPVPLEVIKLLNDPIYYNTCNMTVSAMCIHLSQISALKDIHVYDATPFPLIGLLLLCRGIQTLTCRIDAPVVKELVLEIANLNNIEKERILFLDNLNDMSTNTVLKYGVFVNNYIEHPYADLNSQNINMLQDLKSHIERFNGIVLPHMIRLMGCLIFSEDIETNNRVDNKHVSNYKIAESINIFQVTQSYVPDISLFPYNKMTENIVIFEDCIDGCSNKIIDVQIAKAGLVNGVLCWYEIQYLENGEYFSTLHRDSFINSKLHILEDNLLGQYQQKGHLLVSVEDHCVKLAVDLHII